MDVDTLVAKLNEECQLKRWNELVEEVNPTDNALAAAIMTGRGSLVKLAKPRVLSEDECRKLYHLIGVLMETNSHLQQHAQHVAILVEQWREHFKGMATSATKVIDFANFRSPTQED